MRCLVGDTAGLEPASRGWDALPIELHFRGGTRTHNLSLGGSRRNRTSEMLIKSQLPYHSAMLPYYGGPNHDFSLNSHLPAHTHDGRRVSTLAPTARLEHAGPYNGQRFSGPLRYQLRYKSAYCVVRRDLHPHPVQAPRKLTKLAVPFPLYRQCDAGDSTRLPLYC